MARLRKEKGHSSSGKGSGSKTASNALKKQIEALGGDEDDYVKDVGDDVGTSGSSANDPALAKDVSDFLKGMNIKGKQPERLVESSSNPPAKTSRQKRVKVVEPKTSPAKPPKRDGKAQEEDPKPGKHAKTSSDPQKATPIPPPVAEPPKVILPAKVTLNSKSHFIFQPCAQWYLALPDLPPTTLPAPTAAELSSLTTRAAALHEKDILTFQQSSSSNSSSSEASFLQKIIQSGTLSDRLSALTLLVQSSPLHNIKALEALKGMAERGKGQGGREESLKALRCVSDWWVGGGAPARKLKYFRDQPLQHPSVTDEYLVLWYFEDWLKKYFFLILQVLETLSLDPLQYVRTQSIPLIFTLLRENPEQEQNLLRLLVNKLGDIDKSMCSRTSYHILQLLQSHPSMKFVIVREIISLVLRPPVPPAPSSTNKHIRFNDSAKSKTADKSAAIAGGNVHARYYAAITFNQIVLTPNDREVATQLINVYFEIFKEVLGEGKSTTEDVGEGDEDVEASGKSKQAVKGKEKMFDKGGRIRDNGKGKRGSKGIEVKGAAGFAEVEDGQSKLISAILTGVNRALPFAKLDAADANLSKHIDTLFLITHTSTFNTSLQALVLIQQIASSLAPSVSSSATAKTIIDRYYRTFYASLHDPRLVNSSKQAMYLNLLFKSIKSDPDVSGERTRALVRRFVQVLVSGGGGAAEFVAGGLFLLGELFNVIPGLRNTLEGSAPSSNEGTYDALKRDPQFARASSSPLWELTPLLHHYHPAISLHARQLLSGQPLTATADLSLNTLSHFLDRFVYKNPKKVTSLGVNGIEGKAKGASAMQPAASALDGTTGVKLMKGEVGESLVNEAKFLRQNEKDVPVDQLFFHKFFTRKHEKEKAKSSKVEKRKAHSDDSDQDEDGDEDDGDGDEASSDEDSGQNDDEVKDGSDADSDSNSDLDEAEIWKAMKATIPRVEGDEDLLDDSDPDDDLSEDLDDEQSPSEDEDGDDLELAEMSDNEDLVSLGGDLPEGLIAYDGSDADEEDEEEEWGGVGAESKKRKRDEKPDSKSARRKKLRSLPTFANYEDYAKLIEGGPEDDI